MKFYTDIDLKDNKLSNVVLDPVFSDPSPLDREGKIWYNKYDDVFKYFDGKGVQVLGSRQYIENLLSEYDSTIEVEIQQVRDDHAADVNNLHNEILSNRAELEAIISQLSSDISSQQEAAISTLEAKHDQDVSDLSTRIDGVVSTHTADKEELLNNIASNKEELLDKIAEEKTEVLNVVSDLDQSLTDYCNSKIEEVNEEISSINEDISSISDEISSIKNESIVDINNTLAALENDISDLADDLSDKYTEVNNKIDNNIDALSARIDEEVDNLTTTIDSEKDDLDKTKLEIKLCCRGEYDDDNVLIRLFENVEGQERAIDPPTSNYLYLLRSEDTDLSTQSDNPNHYNAYVWVEGGYDLVSATDIRLNSLEVSDIDDIWESAFAGDEQIYKVLKGDGLVELVSLVKQDLEDVATTAQSNLDGAIAYLVGDATPEGNTLGELEDRVENLESGLESLESDLENLGSSLEKL